ncbi:MAG TPA: hypothetical protein ENJ28_07715 [Gammaproteobacteria bacterium]|nr:hypothetical protein [Gammaproteobacteria bacterium]
MTDNKTSLLFVYNADSGIFNTLSDIAHKVFSPDTYACNLCAITHSHFSMRKPWSDFLKTLNIELEFLHRDELEQQYGKQNVALPAIFFKDPNKNLQLAVPAEAINQCDSMEQLQDIIKKALKQVEK